jgi:hypothetical protein
MLRYFYPFRSLSKFATTQTFLYTNHIFNKSFSLNFVTKSKVSRNDLVFQDLNNMAVPATRTTMEDEIERLWSLPIDRLPVYKDLPRLAGRITVYGQFSTKKTSNTTTLAPPTSSPIVQQSKKTEEKKSGTRTLFFCISTKYF